jgi:hypothetical protein
MENKTRGKRWLIAIALVLSLFGFCAIQGGQGTSSEEGPTAFSGDTASPLVSITQSGPGDGLDVSVTSGNVITGTAVFPNLTSVGRLPEKRNVFIVDRTGNVEASSYRNLSGNPIVQATRWPVSVDSFTSLTAFIKWPRPFTDAAYTATCSLQLASGGVGDIEYLEIANTSAVGIYLYLQLNGPTVHIVHCIAVHD